MTEQIPAHRRAVDAPRAAIRTVDGVPTPDPATEELPKPAEQPVADTSGLGERRSPSRKPGADE